MDYEQIRQSAKMRLCRALSSAVLAPLQDGIEKVRGSTPLISTTFRSAFHPSVATTHVRNRIRIAKSV